MHDIKSYLNKNKIPTTVNFKQFKHHKDNY